jgi:hypothetical protein
MKHQNLITLELLVKKFLNQATNQAYSRNNKFGYRYSWEKGKGQVQDNEGHKHKEYYVCRLYLIDKNESPLGVEVDLLVSYYPVRSLVSVNKLQEEALEELLLNGMQSLINVTYAMVLEGRKREFVEPSQVELDEVVENLKEQAKTPRLII